MATVLAALVVPALLLDRSRIPYGELPVPAPLPALVLSFLFMVAIACPVDLWLAGRARQIDVSAAPLAAGLLVAHAADLLLARVIAVLVIVGLCQGRGQRAVLNVVPVLAGTAAALLPVQLLSVPLPLMMPERGRWQVVALAVVPLALLIVVPLALLVESVVVVLLREPAQAVESGRHRPGLLPDGLLRNGLLRNGLLRNGLLRNGLLRKGLLRGVTDFSFAAVGAFSVVADAQGRVVLAAGLAGSTVLLAHRGFVSLVERQVSLERLYELSGALADAPTRSDIVSLALYRAAELLRAGYAEVVLAGSRDVRPQSWSLRTGHGVYGPQDCASLVSAVASAGMAFPVARPIAIRAGTPGGTAFLAARGVREALVVPLRVDGALRGQLTVADPLRDVGGFAASGLRLLATVANHASVALRNAQLLDRLSFEARHDELTGLPNRLEFRELLDAAAEQAVTGVCRCSVMLLDFDGFKAINDTLGHQAGDDLLRVLAGRLAAVAGAEATVARLGGDEFAVLSTRGETAARAEELARRLLAVFDEPVAVAGTRLRVGGSLGIALGPWQGRTGSDLMRNADIAMYAAKQEGCGFRLYGEELVASSAGVLALASDLPDAIAEDRIDIAVQPIMALSSRSLHSVEVLARWRHPEQGEIDPRTLFAAAERSGQVTALSLRILDRALKLSREWRDTGSLLRVCVNLAPRWLADPQLPDHVALALARHGLAPDVLGLEINERSVIADPTRAMQTLARLRDLGVHLSVDDFGTGYSSLTYLSRLPVDQLKIDTTFIETICTSLRDQAIVSSIVHLGGSLGLEVVAEGVSDSQTLAVLLQMGCRLGQGYLFTRPLEPRAFDEFVAARLTLPAPRGPQLDPVLRATGSS